ncbi:YdcF family protein [Halobacillus sp. Marseille-Q1614]|uniref:YdcF family protein n=1 Tax=Halobacillus sp. Marseille-Q1614 TaxID=2709134 RepID=UPI00156FFBA8|nr:YdcF family protein [Halobacillus sp. Marseille-Q1614]
MKFVIRLAVIVILFYTIFTGYSIWTYGESGREDEADAAVVLGAAQWNGSPSPVFEGRLKQGIELYKNGQVDVLIMTGGAGHGSSLSEAEVGKQFAIKQGVPSDDIIVEDKSLETKENISNSVELIKIDNIESLLIVSDSFHLKRAVSIARNLGISAEGASTKYSAYQSLETKLPFFFEEWAYYMGYEVSRLFRDLAMSNIFEKLKLP